MDFLPKKPSQKGVFGLGELHTSVSGFFLGKEAIRRFFAF